MPVVSELGGFSTFSQGLLIGFPALFSITDSPGNSIVFAHLVADRSDAERAFMARRIGIYAFLLLIVTLWAGAPVLTFFGITLPALKLAGGLAVAASGWRLLYSQNTAKESDQPKTQSPTMASAADMAFFPLTMPLVVGPGAISVSITLGAAHQPEALQIPYLIGLSVAAALVAVIVWILFAYADYTRRFLGKTGAMAVKRLVALFLLTIGIQIMAYGVQNMAIPFVQSAFHETSRAVTPPSSP